MRFLSQLLEITRSCAIVCEYLCGISCAKTESLKADSHKAYRAHAASMLFPCRSPAMPCVNPHMPRRAPAVLRQCPVLRECPHGSRKYPNC